MLEPKLPRMSRTNLFTSFSIGLLVLLCLSVSQGQVLIKTIKSDEAHKVYVGQADLVTFEETYGIAKFKGIRYADAPVKEKRFSKVEGYKPKEEIVNAIQFGNVCWQKTSSSCLSNQTMDEDCLFLNVFVPIQGALLKEIIAEIPGTKAPTDNTKITTESTRGVVSHTPSTTTTKMAPTTTTTTKMTTKTTTKMPISSPAAPNADDTQMSSDSEPKHDTSVKSETAKELPTANSKKDVFIYIHGGGYTSGNGNCFDPSVLANFGDVIVVTINYRLGALGFLDTEDGIIPGNLGLFDQHVAIKWVHENIHLFGGDPQSVTIGGQSAGSYSSILQALYKPNHGLFQRVIAQSGTPADKKSLNTVGYATTMSVANLVGCDIKGDKKSQALKDCLMQQKPADLVNVSPPWITPGSLPIQPSLDKDFVITDPNTFLARSPETESGQAPVVPDYFLEKDLLIGFNAEDGDVVYILRSFVLAASNFTKLKNYFATPISTQMFREIVKEYIQSDKEDKIDDQVINAVLDRYINWGQAENAAAVSNQAVKMMTDTYFGIPSVDTALSHSKGKSNSKATVAQKSNRKRREAGQASTGGSTYLYRFSLSETNVKHQKNLPWFEGTHHSAELPYVFGYQGELQADGGLAMSKAMMTYWTNFIKTGNPNVSKPPGTPPSTTLPQWGAFNATDQHFLEIGKTSELKQGLEANSIHFWSNYLPEMTQHLRDLKKDISAAAKNCKTTSEVKDAAYSLTPSKVMAGLSLIMCFVYRVL